MFPFAGMPQWAQWLGACIPATHFLRIVRGVMLKGAHIGDIAGELIAMLAILAVIGAISMLRYRQTLD
jgi:ABC-2 type transport system permease protein